MLEKAEAHCVEHGVAQDTIIQASLADDMLPFGYQVKSTIVHSVGAIDGVRRGSFSPDTSSFGQTFAELAESVLAARDALAALDPEEVNGFEGRPMRFEIKAWHADYSAESFLLSFSKPNFYFHAATAYGLLRAGNVQIGKVDFLGTLDLKKAG